MQGYWKKSLPVKPTRRTPHPHPEATFGEGLTEETSALCEPIDQRALPTICGVGLLRGESARVNGARNRARVEFAAANPQATDAAIEAAGRAAATEKLKQVLRERPAAPPLPRPSIRSRWEGLLAEMGVRVIPPSARKRPRSVLCSSLPPICGGAPTHTKEDETWWAIQQDAESRGEWILRDDDPEPEPTPSGSWAGWGGHPVEEW